MPSKLISMFSPQRLISTMRAIFYRWLKSCRRRSVTGFERRATRPLNLIFQLVSCADALKQEFPLTRYLAAAKMAHYLDGTTEIQNVVISRALQKVYANRKAD
jgi:alkylation response protein AidB-like acyl-CoA dehydrogenase